MIILKVYSGLNDTTPDQQFENIEMLNIEEDVNNFDIANIQLPLYISGLSQFQKVEVYDVWSGSDNILFNGFIYALRVNTKSITITCRGTKAILYKKLVLSDKSYTGQTINTIINDLLSDWNTAYSETWTCTDDPAWTIDKDLKEGDNLYDVIEELTWQLWLVFDIVWSDIRVRETLWEDKSTGSSFTEAVYNQNNPRENTIDNVELETFDSISNVIIGKAENWTRSVQTDATSITNFWALWEFVAFRDWGLAAQTSEYLASKKLEQKLYKVNIEPNSLSANKGDIIYLRIENVNDYINFEGSAIVNTKNIEFINGVQRVTLWLSNIYVFRDTFTNKLNKVNRDVNVALL